MMGKSAAVCLAFREWFPRKSPGNTSLSMGRQPPAAVDRRRKSTGHFQETTKSTAELNASERGQPIRQAEAVRL